MRNQLNIWGKKKQPFVFLIDFEGKKPLCWPMKSNQKKFLFNFNGITNANFEKINFNQSFFNPQFISKQQYQKKFEAVKKEIQFGNTYLINLTVETKIKSDLTLKNLFYLSKAKYTCLLKNNFVCYSPETFVKISQNKIFTYPMKGTINALLPNAKKIILADEKEAAEHATIVDLLRNDLSRVAKNVTVKKYRYYETIKTSEGMIGQVSSEISGELPQKFNEKIGDIIFELLPAGSISGAPKNKTIEIIKRVEKKPRGYYTGIAGYFDGENLDSCVLIRFLQQNKTYRSGGGITFLSKLEKEYEEIKNKVYVPFF